jgi:hypothetical protein
MLNELQSHVRADVVNDFKVRCLRIEVNHCGVGRRRHLWRNLLERPSQPVVSFALQGMVFIAPPYRPPAPVHDIPSGPLPQVLKCHRARGSGSGLQYKPSDPQKLCPRVPFTVWLNARMQLGSPYVAFVSIFRCFIQNRWPCDLTASNLPRDKTNNEEDGDK